MSEARAQALALMRGTDGATRVRRYTPLALGGLAASAGLPLAAYAVLAPDIGRTLGVSTATVAALGLLSSAALALAMLPLAQVAASHRVLACLLGGTGVAAAALVTVVVTGPWGLAGALVLGGICSAAVAALHPALVADAAPAGARVRAFAYYRALDFVGLLAAPALVAALVAWAGLSWRGVYLAIAGVALIAVAAALRLRDPGIGGEDARGLSALVRVTAEPDGAGTDDRPRPGSLEIAGDLMRVPSVRWLLVAAAAGGVFLAPLIAYLSVFLDDRYGLDAAERGVFYAATGAVTIAALALFARDGERALRAGPSAALARAWRLLAAVVVAMLAGVAIPSFAVMVASFCAAYAGLGLLLTLIPAALMTMVPPTERVHAGALLGLAIWGAGGLGGTLLLGGLAEGAGVHAALAALAVPGVAAVLALRAAGAHAEADFAGMVEAILDDEEIAAARGSGPPPPLACRGLVVDFGHLRALDGVDFAVEQGEAVAVLGTNGAGKSTLLRVLAGLRAPTAGAVRIDGWAVNALRPERRAALGLALVAGEGSLFDSLNVRDSLLVAAEARGLRGEAARSAVGDALGSFALLAERAASPAAALSGGERQLLALAQALVHRPRLLLVDELTSGLASEAADELLDRLRALRAEGTTLVFVEQSAELAARLATRAVFLERGRVRFDGTPRDLLRRHDLLRPVLLAALETG